MAVDIEQAGAVIGFVNQMIVPDLVVQRGRLGHERKPYKRICVNRRSADTRETVETPARHQAARASPDVAEVVNRPKKRPGRRQRSSITIRPASSYAMLV
jgi:hypothetical protein